MPSSSRSLLTITSYLLSFLSLVSAHTVITYPGWRGNNLHTYGNVTDPGVDGLGAGPNGTYPYGMQWIYPCMSKLSIMEEYDTDNEQVEVCLVQPTAPFGP